MTIPRGQRENLKVTIEVDSNIIAPITAGKSYGVLNISHNGEILEQRELLAANNIESAPLLSRLWDHFILFIRGVFGLN